MWLGASGVRLAGLAAVATLACGPRARPAPAVIPAVGMSIAIHGGDVPAAVVEDVRWIDVAGDAVLLDRVDRDAALASVVLEPLVGDLRVGACVRERLDPAVAPVSPLVHCAVRARPGRYLVRVLHVAPLGFRAQHAIAMTAPDRATVSTRFAIATPAWQARTRVVLFDRAPGGATPPREVARGTITLDGGTAVLAPPARTAAARIRHVYDGMVDDVDRRPHDLAWGEDSHGQVRVWLEAEARGLGLPAGDTTVHVALPGRAPRDVVVRADRRVEARGVVRWPLWIDEDLWGRRTRTVERTDGAGLTERVQLAVFNGGDRPRTVWIEERLRPARSLLLSGWHPVEPTVTRSRVRHQVVVAPGATARLGFVVAYSF